MSSNTVVGKLVDHTIGLVPKLVSGISVGDSVAHIFDKPTLPSFAPPPNSSDQQISDAEGAASAAQNKPGRASTYLTGYTGSSLLTPGSSTYSAGQSLLGS